MIKKTLNYQNHHVNCNLCGRNNTSIFLNKITSWEHFGIFETVICNNCDLVYLNPRPNSEVINKYYPDEKYWGWDTSRNTKKIRMENYEPLYSKILSRKRRGLILDIGCGSGLFLSEFKDKGWNAQGTETSVFAANIAKNTYGLKIKVGDFLSLDFKPNYVDVISLNNVLEHLYNPVGTLMKAHMVLKKNGMIIITVPNIQSLGFSLFKRNWHPLQPPRHLYHFSKKTLTKIVESSGFKVEGYIMDYKTHIIYALFESFRFKYSPKFSQTKKGGLSQAKYVHSGVKEKVIMFFGKLIGKILAHSLYILEIILRKPEVITIYASKL